MKPDTPFILPPAIFDLVHKRVSNLLFLLFFDKFQVLQINATSSALDKALSIENEEDAKALEKVRALNREKSDCLKEIIKLQEERESLVGLQQTPVQFLSGDTKFNFGAIKPETQPKFYIPVDRYSVVVVNSWNCTIASHSCVPSGINDPLQAFVVECVIKPAAFAFSTKVVDESDPTEKSWFIRVRLSWEGMDYYPPLILQLKEKTAELEVKVRDLAEQVEQTNQKRIGLSLKHVRFIFLFFLFRSSYL